MDRRRSSFLSIEKVAMKILNKTKLDASTQRLLRREISSMERMHHPNIIRLYEVIETAREIYIITEYAPGGDLYTRVTNEGKFTESDAKYFFAQITAAVDHMVTEPMSLSKARPSFLLFCSARQRNRSS